VMKGESWRFRPHFVLLRCFNPRPSVMKGESLSTTDRRPEIHGFQSTPLSDEGRIRGRRYR